MSRPPLDALAAAVGPGLGEGVHSGSATIEPTPVPGLPGTVVWLVRDDSRDHPMQAYAGHWPDGQVRVLSDHQDAWADLVRDVGAHIDTVAMALGYVRAFLECTRGSAVAVREITAADELPWRPGSPDEERRRAEFLGGPPVPEPRAVAQDGGFHVELTLIVGQRVQRNLFDVTAAGVIDASFSVLADDLPLPIVR